jgi:hypothetical protein
MTTFLILINIAVMIIQKLADKLGSQTPTKLINTIILALAVVFSFALIDDITTTIVYHNANHRASERCDYDNEQWCWLVQTEHRRIEKCRHLMYVAEHVNDHPHCCESIGIIITLYLYSGCGFYADRHEGEWLARFGNDRSIDQA